MPLGVRNQNDFAVQIRAMIDPFSRILVYRIGRRDFPDDGHFGDSIPSPKRPDREDTQALDARRPDVNVTHIE